MNYKSLSIPTVKPWTALASIALSAASACAAHGQTIISDSYSDTPDGTAITAHVPDTDLPGSVYGSQSPDYGPTVPATISDDAVKFNTNNQFYISIASEGTYTKPTSFTVSADLKLGTLVPGAADPTNGATRGLALGFYSAVPAIYTRGDITGLLLEPDGSLGLASDGNLYGGVTQLQTFDADNFDGNAFDPTQFYTLSYTVNITSGISDVTLSDADGSQNYSFTGTSGLFTDAQTSYVGAESNSGNGGSISYLDNLSVVGPGTTMTPEPSTWALMLAGFACLAGWQRVRRNA